MAYFRCKIATADDSGSIYGVRAGSTTVTAYSEDYIYIFHVSVNSSEKFSRKKFNYL